MPTENTPNAPTVEAPTCISWDPACDDGTKKLVAIVVRTHSHIIEVHSVSVKDTASLDEILQKMKSRHTNPSSNPVGNSNE